MKIKLLIYLFSLLVIFNFSICGTQYEPYQIKIGFIGSFTTGHSDWGIAGRRGFVLAAEEQNRAGGINGYKIQLVLQDDENMPYKAANNVNEFADKGVVAAIGFFSNGVLAQSVDAIRKNNLLVITPLLSSDLLGKKDSSIIRLSSGNQIQGEKLAGLLIEKKILKTIVFYDEKNKEDNEKIFEAFKARYESQSGKILKAQSFHPLPVSGFEKIAKEIVASKSASVVFISDSFSTALICKELDKLKSKADVYAPIKFLTKDLLYYGGESVKKATLLSENYSEEKKGELYLNFEKKYKERFKTEPTVASLYSYEAAQVLFEAIKHSKDMEAGKLLKTIYKIKDFQGILGNFSIHSQGEASRALNVYKMNKGNIEKVKNK